MSTINRVVTMNAQDMYNIKINKATIDNRHTFLYWYHTTIYK